MINRIPFCAAHFDLIDPPDVLAGMKSRMRLAPLLSRGKAISWVDVDAGEVLVCGGYVLRAPRVFWLWLLPARNGNRTLIHAVRWVRGWMDRQPCPIRFEAEVVAGFAQGVRLVEMLGLERETEVMQRWDGVLGYYRYSRVLT
jgi:hypothetical protein